MIERKQNIKKIILIILFTILIFPFTQESLNLIKIKPLKGAVVLASKDTFSIKKWFSGEFQENEEKYINDNFGFRNIFVRLNNQIAFSVFKIAKANGVIIGKGNYLYEESYINAYNGTDFIGKDSILHVVEKLKFIQDTLSKLNKTLIVVYAPSKSSFYPEFIPKKYNRNNSKTNYSYFIQQSKKNNINFIDFNKFFIEKKNKTKFPLFSKYGIHWSIYSGCIVSDSIIKFIETKRNIKMPHLFWTEIDENNSKESDIDIADGMNLLFNFKDEKMGYPKVQFQNDSDSQKPDVLVISDSFYWIIYSTVSRAFNKNPFWYYNKDVYPENSNKTFTTDSVSLKDEIKKNDVIIIMATTPSLTKIGWKFIQNTYELFKINDRKKRIDKYVTDIKNNSNWLSSIKKFAIEKKISLDEAIMKNAIWMADNELSK